MFENVLAVVGDAPVMLGSGPEDDVQPSAMPRVRQLFLMLECIPSS